MNNKTTCSMRVAQTLATLTLALLVLAPVPNALAQNQFWITQFGVSSRDWAWALAPDEVGGVMIAGYTTGNLGGPNAGYNDVFLARYNESGNRLWIRQFGTSREEAATALASDGAGGVFVAGGTGGSLGGPFAGGSRDAFLARHDDAGNQLWIRQFGTSEWDMASGLAFDGVGGVFVSGYTDGNLGGPNAGPYDAFLARYDGEGNQLWIRQFGSSSSEAALALAPDGGGGVIVAGTAVGSLGGPSAGGWDAFIARFDGAGNRLWLRQFGTNTEDTAGALAFDGEGGVMIAGRTKGNLGGPLGGLHDSYLARYTIDSCYADCDQVSGAGVLDMQDFLCWQDDFVIGNSYACDCDTSTGMLVCDIFDFLCFQNAFVVGCP